MSSLPASCCRYWLPFLVLLGLLCAGAAASAAPGKGAAPELKKGDLPGAVKAAVGRVKKQYKQVQTLVRKKRLTRVRVRIGNRQNPNQIECHHTGATDRDYERDPYANPPLRPRLIVVRATLPAVGDASASFYFTARGKLFFVHTSGADISGVSNYDLSPSSSLRVYYDGKGEVPVRLVSEVPTGRRVFDLPTLPAGDAGRRRAEEAAAVLLKRGRELAAALQVLAR